MFKFAFKFLNIKMKIQFCLLVFASILSSAIGVLMPLISGRFVDNLLIEKSVTTIVNFCILILSMSIGSLLVGYFLQIITIKLTTNSAFSVNTSIIEHVKKLSMTFWKEKNIAYLNQRINNDSNTIMSYCLSSVSNITINAMTLIFTCIVIWQIDYKILFLLFVFLIVYPIIYLKLKKPVFQRGMAVQEAGNNLFSNLNEQLVKNKFIKTHSINSIYKRKLSLSFKKFLSTKIAYQKISYLFSGCDSIVSTLAQTGIFIIGGMAVITNSITIGFFTVVLSFLKMMMGSIRYFFNLGKSYQDTKVSYERIKKIMSESIPPEGSEKVECLNNIYLENLQFKYQDENVIDISLSFEKGKIYCITGENGSGKTTLCELILGLHNGEYLGKIIINDVELGQVDLFNYRTKNIGLTEQNPTICDDSIFENLMLMCATKTKDEKMLFSLIDQFDLNNFINAQPNGINSRINEEIMNLSGGERQKIAIIRQLIQNPDVLIFDEPTSALDDSSARTFCNILEHIKKEKIIIIVSHDEFIELCKEK